MQTMRDHIVTRIERLGEGKAFSAKDFLDIASRGTIDMTLSALNREGKIRRIRRGLYDMPKVNPKLGGKLSPDIDEAARAIARRQRWKIMPEGAWAANLLGLSTQVPAKIIYLTDGPNNEVPVGRRSIHFKHARPKALAGLEGKFALVVQALRHLGNDNQVKKARREFPVKLLALFRPRDRLIEPQVNFIRSVDAALFIERRGEFDLGPVCALDSLRARTELGHCRAERPEIIHHRLINEDVAVGKEQDAFLAPGFPQPPDNLKRGVGLAGARGHDEENSVLALCDGFYRGVDGIGLIVARRFSAAIVEVILQDNRFFIGSESFPRAVF